MVQLSEVEKSQFLIKETEKRLRRRRFVAAAMSAGKDSTFARLAVESVHVMEDQLALMRMEHEDLVRQSGSQRRVSAR